MKIILSHSIKKVETAENTFEIYLKNLSQPIEFITLRNLLQNSPYILINPIITLKLNDSKFLLCNSPYFLNDS